MKSASLAPLLLMAFLLPACTALEPAAARTPAPAVPASPGPSPTPALPPAPTAAPPCFPQPSAPAALQSVQERIDGLVPGARVTWVNGFDCNDLDYGWWIGDSNPQLRVSDDDGMVTISTPRVQNVWDGIGRTTISLGGSSGFLALIRYEEGTSAPICIMSGTFLTESARRWGLAISSDTLGTHVWEGWDGPNYLGPAYIRDVLRPDTWFYLLIRLDDHALVTLKLWEKDHPENSSESRQQMPSRWVGRRFSSVFQVYQGSLQIDEYLELAFDAP